MELKPFPVNGWGIDAYQASIPPVSALVAAGTATAMFYAFTKITAMTGGIFLNASMYIGALTFIGMNIVALKQTEARRLLGYSSVSQVGLLVLVFSLVNIFGLNLGISCSLLIFIYGNEQTSFDQYHKDADRVFRVVE